MSHENEHVHGSRRLHRALGLGLSGVALVGLVYFESMSARAEVDDAVAAEAELDEDAETAEAAENAVPAATPVSLPPSGLAASPPEPATPPTEEAVAMATTKEVELHTAQPMAPTPALVAVPNIKGMTLRKAKKQLAAVGLELAVRDAYGEKIPREHWSGYKVRSQRIDAGTEVEVGSTVKVKARERIRYATGY
jgi:hypothetical protein